MNREETRILINNILDFINGNDEDGHPALYFFCDKTQTENKIQDFLDSKELFNKFDIYFFINSLIKKLVGTYDSHTKLGFINYDWFPIKFKIIDDKVYVINITDSMKEAKGSQLIAINGIPVEKIIKNIESITCYSVKEYLEVQIQKNLAIPNVLKSLPLFNPKETKFVYTFFVNKKEMNYTFDLKKLNDYDKLNEIKTKNYSYKIINDVMVITYNSCKDIEAMEFFVKKINNIALKDSVTKYIIDLRGNTGGDSNVNKPLIRFLKGKKIVTITNEEVFSSARMACVDLLKIGSIFVGNNISTTLSAFGENESLILKDLNMEVNRSTKFFYYDDELKCHSFNKQTFNKRFKTKEYFKTCDLKKLNINYQVFKSLKDYIDESDAQLSLALDLVKEL